MPWISYPARRQVVLVFRVHDHKCVYVLGPRRAARLFGETTGFCIILRAELQCVLSRLTTCIRHRETNNLQTEKLIAILPLYLRVYPPFGIEKSVFRPFSYGLHQNRVWKKLKILLENGFKIKFWAQLFSAKCSLEIIALTHMYKNCFYCTPFLSP